MRYTWIYISIYDRPKQKIGRRLSKLTEDEKYNVWDDQHQQKYYEHIDKQRLQQAQNYQRLKNEKAQQKLLL